jgi:ribosomal protein L11 methyltransferase
MPKEYIAIHIPVSKAETREILVAQMSEAGFEGFEESHSGLTGYIRAEDFNKAALRKILAPWGQDYSLSTLAERNWNAEWEAGFSPVRIGNFCSIRAEFHPPDTGVRFDLVITPKMSFGTGHHATTHLMIQAMEQHEFSGREVFDFGTGTGILAILAEKMGASRVLAIDNDPWSIENAKENIDRNNCSKILILNAQEASPGDFFHIILANINRNVILDSFDQIRQHLSPAGVILLSGLLKGDAEIVLQKAQSFNFQLVTEYEKDGWICLKMRNHQN